MIKTQESVLPVELCDVVVVVVWLPCMVGKTQSTGKRVGTAEMKVDSTWIMAALGGDRNIGLE